RLFLTFGFARGFQFLAPGAKAVHRPQILLRYDQLLAGATFNRPLPRNLLLAGLKFDYALGQHFDVGLKLGQLFLLHGEGLFGLLAAQQRALQRALDLRQRRRGNFQLALALFVYLIQFQLLAHGVVLRAVIAERLLLAIQRRQFFAQVVREVLIGQYALQFGAARLIFAQPLAGIVSGVNAGLQGGGALLPCFQPLEFGCQLGRRLFFRRQFAANLLDTLGIGAVAVAALATFPAHIDQQLLPVILGKWLAAQRTVGRIQHLDLVDALLERVHLGTQDAVLARQFGALLFERGQFVLKLLVLRLQVFQRGDFGQHLGQFVRAGRGDRAFQLGNRALASSQLIADFVARRVNCAFQFVPAHLQRVQLPEFLVKRVVALSRRLQHGVAFLDLHAGQQNFLKLGGPLALAGDFPVDVLDIALAFAQASLLSDFLLLRVDRKSVV